MKVLTDTGLAYYHSKLQNEFISNSSLSDAIDDYLDNVNWVSVIGNTYATSEDVADMISSADLDAYLPKSGGTMTGDIVLAPNSSTNGVSDDTGVMLACRIGEKGTLPSKDKFFSVAVARDDSNTSSNTSTCRYGLLEIKVGADGKNEVSMTAYKNEANETVGATFKVGYDTTNNEGYVTALGNTVATFDSNNKLVFPNGNTIWFA